MSYTAHCLACENLFGTVCFYITWLENAFPLSAFTPRVSYSVSSFEAISSPCSCNLAHATRFFCHMRVVGNLVVVPGMLNLCRLLD